MARSRSRMTARGRSRSAASCAPAKRRKRRSVSAASSSAGGKRKRLRKAFAASRKTRRSSAKSPIRAMKKGRKDAQLYRLIAKALTTMGYKVVKSPTRKIVVNEPGIKILSSAMRLIGRYELAKRPVVPITKVKRVNVKSKSRSRGRSK